MTQLPSTKQYILRFELLNKKSLGQNFIINDSLTDKIISKSKIKNNVIIEIGPGPGCLTRSILKQQPKKLILIEKDQRFNPIYKEFAEFFNIEIEVINADCLEINFNQFGHDLTLISNLPYNISSKIYVDLLTKYGNISNMTLMFQKEVAERIIAQTGDKNFSRLSVISQLLGKADKLFLVKPTAFLPPPKIMSMVINFERNNSKHTDINIEKFGEFTKLLFGSKRKIIKNQLKQITLNNSDQISEDILSKRPHQLSIKEILDLFSIINMNN